jgi:hypothetical protein
MSDGKAGFQSVRGSRVAMREDANETIIRMPSAKQPVLMFYLVGFVFLLGVSGGYDLWQALTPVAAFEISALASAFAKLGLSAISLGLLLWQSFGVETIEAHRASLCCIKSVLFFRRKRNYSPHVVSDFQFVAPSSGYLQVKFVPPLSKIEFEYGSKTVRIFRGIDEVGFAAVLAALQRRFSWGHSN